MKKILFTVVLTLLFSSKNLSQQNQDPSLSVGLESLTFGKGSIDVDAIRKILIRKQNELKREGLKRFIFSKLPKYHHTTKLFLQNSITTLIEEKNQNIIEKEILELSTNYSLIIGFSNIYEKIYYTQKKAPLITKYFDVIKPNIPKKLKKQFLIDIVGTALSSNKVLKSRGFFDFDSKIDFTKSKLYSLFVKNDIQDEDISTFLIELKLRIDKTVTAYLGSYKYIKDILKDQDYSKLENIKDLYLNETKSNLIENDDLFADFANNINDSKFIDALEVSVMLSKLKEHIDLFNFYLPKFKSLANITALQSKTSNFSEEEYQTYLRLQLEQSKLKLQNYQNIKDGLPFFKNKTDEIYTLLKNTKQKVGTILQKESSFLNFENNVLTFKKSIDAGYKNIKLLNEFYIISTNKLKSIRGKDLLTFKDVKDFRDSVNTKLEEFNLTFISRNLNFLNLDAINNFKLKLNEYQKEIKFKALENVEFMKQILRNVANQILSKNFNNKDSIFIRENAEFFSDLYINTKKLSEKKKLNIDDVLYFEKKVLPQLVKAKILVSDKDNDKIIDNIINATNSVIPLMKYYLTPEELTGLEVNKEIISFFEFISNIDKLDKANTFSFILQLLDESHVFFVNSIYDNEDIKDFRKIYEKLINGIEKYTILNNKDDIIEVDVLSLLNTFIEQYNKENSYGKHAIYFTIGLSQNTFIKDYKFQTDGVENTINSIGFASEKIGYKRKLLSFKNDNYQNMAKSPINPNDKKNEPNPFINQWYMTIYGSGLLYKLANLTTNQSFEFPHVGIGTGLRFYNSLDLNLSIGFPFIENQKFGNNAFIGISFDIPIGEYISAIGTGKQ